MSPADYQHFASIADGVTAVALLIFGLTLLAAIIKTQKFNRCAPLLALSITVLLLGTNLLLHLFTASNIPSSVYQGLASVTALATVGMLVYTPQIFKFITFLLSRSDISVVEESLAHQVELLEEIVNNTNTVVFVKDLDGKYQFINRRFEELFGFTLEEAKGKDDYELFPKPQAEAFRQNDQDVVRSNSLIEVEEKAPHEDGLHTYSSVKFPIHDKDGEILAVGGLATDITPLVRATDELKEAHSFLDSIIENVPSMLFVKEVKESRFVRVNRAFEEMVGQDREDLLGKNDYDFFPKEQADHFISLDREALFSPETIDIPRENITASDGTERVLHTRKTAIRDEDGNPTHLLGIAHDITEKENALAELAQMQKDLEERVEARTRELHQQSLELQREIQVREQAEQHFSVAVEAAPNGMLLVNAKGEIVLVNKEAERLFQYPREELLGEHIETLVPEGIRTEHEILRDRFFKDPNLRKMGSGRDLYGRRRDGSEFPIEVGLNPLEKDGISYVIGTVVDITERKLAEKRERQHAIELERSNAALDQYAHAASHDLKAPLRAINQLASWITQDAEESLPAESKEHLHKLRLRITRMENLLDDLLRYSRAGRQSTTPEAVSFPELLQDIIFFVNPPKGFKVKFDTNLGIVHTAKAPLELVLRNLVDNAIKHHNREDGLVEIQAEVVDSDWLEIIVRDDGPGIPEEYHEKVFEMFKTLRPRDEVEGSGLGLSLVKKLVENVDGSITLQSVEEEGCSFRIRWPYKPAAVD